MHPTYSSLLELLCLPLASNVLCHWNCLASRIVAPQFTGEEIGMQYLIQFCYDGDAHLYLYESITSWWIIFGCNFQRKPSELNVILVVGQQPESRGTALRKIKDVDIHSQYRSITFAIKPLLQRDLDK